MILDTRYQWRAVNFYVEQAKKQQEKFDILSKFTVFRSPLIYSIWFVISDIQIVSDRGCQYDFLKILETLKKKILEKTFFTRNVIYKKNRKLLGNLPVNTWRFAGNYLVIYWSSLSI